VEEARYKGATGLYSKEEVSAHDVDNLSVFRVNNLDFHRCMWSTLAPTPKPSHVVSSDVLYLASRALLQLTSSNRTTSIFAKSVQILTLKAPIQPQRYCERGTLFVLDTV